jgi:hypothetical protein
VELLFAEHEPTSDLKRRRGQEPISDDTEQREELKSTTNVSKGKKSNRKEEENIEDLGPASLVIFRTLMPRVKEEQVIAPTNLLVVDLPT